MFTLSYRSPHETVVNRTVSAAGLIWIFSVTATVVVLLLLRLTRVVGQHEILGESRSLTEIRNNDND